MPVVVSALAIGLPGERGRGCGRLLFATVMSLYNFASHSIGHFHSLYLTSVLIFHPSQTLYHLIRDTH